MRFLNTKIFKFKDGSGKKEGVTYSILTETYDKER